MTPRGTLNGHDFHLSVPGCLHLLQAPKGCLKDSIWDAARKTVFTGRSQNNEATFGCLLLSPDGAWPEIDDKPANVSGPLESDTTMV
jgi:hypothetical protein